MNLQEQAKRKKYAQPKNETRAIQIRFPIKLYNLLSEGAKKSHRSFNSEVIFNLEKIKSEKPV